MASAQDWAKAQAWGGTGANQYRKEQSDGGITLHSDTRASRQILSGAGVVTQRQADKVARENPELTKKVIAGEISLPKAYEQVTGKGQQALIVAQAQDWEKAQVNGANRYTVKTGQLAGLTTIEDRAVLSGASHRTQRRADKIAREAP